MKKRYLISISLLLALFFPKLIHAQLADDYRPHKLSGPVPADLQTDVREETLNELKASGNALGEKEGKQYYAMSNYVFRQAMQSGKVYFNDPFSAYLNQIVDKLLKAEPALRDKIRVYATRISVPNASAWRNGVIFFNMPLFSYLESEAQIAYVLAHEITHFKNKHNLQRFKRKMEIENSFRRKSAETDELFELMRFSRENELEADLEAFKMLNKSGYKTIEAMATLRQLQKINENPVVFSQSLEDLFQIKDSLFEFKAICDSAKFSVVKDEEIGPDSLSTHPDIERRIEIIERELGKLENAGEGAMFLVKDETSFEVLKDQTYIEQVQNLYDKGAYMPALYGALRLASHYPENLYLQEIAGKSLYWISRYKLAGDKDEVVPDSDFLSGSYGLFVCYFEKKHKSQIGKLAKTFIEERSMRFPQSANLAILKAKIYQILEEEGLAKKALNQYLEKFPDSPHAAYAKISLENFK